MGRRRDPKVTKLRAEAQRLYDEEELSIEQVAQRLGVRFHIARDYILLKEEQGDRKLRVLGPCEMCGSPGHTRFKKRILCRECMIGEEDEPTLEDYLSGKYELGVKWRP